MQIGLDSTTFLMGIVIFLARVTDVTMGTIRTISIVQGRPKTAFFLGLIEVSMWLVVISAVIHKIVDHPILGVFYALGFSTGNVVGIFLERRLAFGHIALRIISSESGMKMAESLRAESHAVTIFHGEGLSGSVIMLYIVCRRKDLKQILERVRTIDQDAFYSTEQTGSVSKLYHPISYQETGWRAIFKKK